MVERCVRNVKRRGDFHVIFKIPGQQSLFVEGPTFCAVFFFAFLSEILT